jgi:hypothetical protein
MKKSSKRVFSLATLLKLFLLTSITAAHPVKTTNENSTTLIFNQAKQSPPTSIMFIPKKPIFTTIQEVLLIK